MFDPASESPIPLLQVSKVPWLPRRRRGRRLHASTVFRWAGRGLRGVRLETMRTGGTLCTSEEALKRFFERLSNPAAVEAADSSRQVMRRHNEAEVALDAEGI